MRTYATYVSFLRFMLFLYLTPCLALMLGISLLACMPYSNTHTYNLKSSLASHSLYAAHACDIESQPPSTEYYTKTLLLIKEPWCWLAERSKPQVSNGLDYLTSQRYQWLELEVLPLIYITFIIIKPLINESLTAQNNSNPRAQNEPSVTSQLASQAASVCIFSAQIGEKYILHEYLLLQRSYHETILFDKGKIISVEFMMNIFL